MAKKQKEQKSVLEKRIWFVEKSGEYLTGVFDTTESLNKFMATTRKGEIDKGQVTKITSCHEFPVYILSHQTETGTEFMCFSEKKSAQEKYKEEKWKKGVVYVVEGNFSSPGKNQMAKLKPEKL